MGAGRPSKYDSLDLDKVSIVARKGWTDAEMASFFEVDVATWHRWKLKHVEFCDALKDWKTEADARVERSLYERATGYSCPEDKIFNNNGEEMIVHTTKHYPPDTTAAIFWLKNRDKENWRDVQGREHSGNVGVEAYELSETERSARITALLNEARGRRDGEADNSGGADMDSAGGSTD
jgi:hypothetical protein